MRKDRLKTLADYLRISVPKEHFDLACWVDIDGGEIVDGAITKIGCDTAACAVGWACSIPELHQQGLYFDAKEEVPVFGAYRNWNAVRAFFELTPKEADHLFYDDSYEYEDRQDPLAVATRIEELIRE